MTNYTCTKIMLTFHLATGNRRVERDMCGESVVKTCYSGFYCECGKLCSAYDGEAPVHLNISRHVYAACFATRCLWWLHH
jgi:hypothetical protein